MKDSEVEVLVLGLSAHGVIVQMSNGRLGFMLSGGSRSEFAAHLAAHYGSTG